jgi:hypothetical protein
MLAQHFDRQTCVLGLAFVPLAKYIICFVPTRLRHLFTQSARPGLHHMRAQVASPIMPQKQGGHVLLPAREAASSEAAFALDASRHSEKHAMQRRAHDKHILRDEAAETWCCSLFIRGTTEQVSAATTPASSTDPSSAARVAAQCRMTDWLTASLPSCQPASLSAMAAADWSLSNSHERYGATAIA